ncbi:4-hydroxythreonine-4-phosphate dehydrogenase PdxA [Formicincola oecophyllae]|uniref:4-hydroxythreonine-4-phosphate dehydrogenase n=1 Tax=Formicincola oecophyllae TaxID=2558361 RepID=A0A4Y6UAK3_9PROT|nr:4-hydroxythreonine-4-phosphate dehydrogenase PdxA [Formicincola oecophyllae]QDH14503.1 4-hydroxythreonine-4-phosphate dehydrogenase PdxA [Formicincola oecophyllae]
MALGTVPAPLPPLAVTMGDPAGIGPEITAALWRQTRGQGPVFCWYGDPALMAGAIPTQAITHPSQAACVFANALPVMVVRCPEPVTPGTLDSANSPAVVAAITQATQAALAGDVAGVVTAPIAKHVLKAAGFSFPGHTEFIASLTGQGGEELMMLACPPRAWGHTPQPGLRVVLATIHTSLASAVAALQGEGGRARIMDVARRTVAALKRDFGLPRPRLWVAGLNPHAGEDGMMGCEERDVISPALEALKAEGLDVEGPMPPDTMFTPAARARYDAALCLYHDQGLIPLKTLGMEEGVNITLGLDVVRTSPDHGTAFDIARPPSQWGSPAQAGQRVADARSLHQALLTAQAIAKARSTH